MTPECSSNATLFLYFQRGPEGCHQDPGAVQQLAPDCRGRRSRVLLRRGAGVVGYGAQKLAQIHGMGPRGKIKTYKQPIIIELSLLGLISEFEPYGQNVTRQARSLCLKMSLQYCGLNCQGTTSFFFDSRPTFCSHNVQAPLVY